MCPASSFAQGGSPAVDGAANVSVAVEPPAARSASSSSLTNINRKRSAKLEHREAARQQRTTLLQRRAQLPDPTLDALANNNHNAQFITGRCVSARDCGASQTDLSKVCCASVVDAATGATVGVCSGSAVGAAAPKLGCGFGDGAASSAVGGGGGGADAVQLAMAAPVAQNAPVAQAAPVGVQQQPAVLPDPGLDAGRGNGRNGQFVTGACVDSGDCGAEQADLGNVCCASVVSGGQVVGVCSGSAVGNAAPKMGCGFGDGKANSAV